ncbi:hypothetical protein IPH25_00825 [bacterium]|nr:MAG: hypothetical protein IPG37_02945 [bacterium]QQR61971.1 MAG: hypothetical protein IPH25_00825 [bacterium]QQR62436.1 MAG: hypothetical protein IPH67_03335 [bacterium]
MKKISLIVMTVLFFAQHAHADNPTETKKAVTKEAVEQVQNETKPEEKQKVQTYSFFTGGNHEVDELSVKQALRVIAGCFIVHASTEVALIPGLTVLSNSPKPFNSSIPCHILLATTGLSCGLSFNPLCLAYQSLLQKMGRKLKTYSVANKIMSAKMWNYLPMKKVLTQALTMGAALATLVAALNIGASVGSELQDYYISYKWPIKW